MSVSAKAIPFFLGFLNFKKLIEKSLQNPKRTNKPLIFNSIKRKYTLIETEICNRFVVTILPKSTVSDTHILYFHGGGYVLEGTTMHTKIVDFLVEKLQCKLSYLNYPLAPEHTYIQTFDMVQQSFNALISIHPTDTFVFMGDSAGGGLAMAFAQKLQVENALVQPEKLVLFSPWIDISMSNPVIKLHEKWDKILSVEALILAAQKYAGDADLKHYLLSPLYGKLMSLPPTLVFYGTEELLHPDCMKLQEITSDFGNFTFEEFQGMQHDWVLFPISEAKDALNKAVDFICLSTVQSY